MGGGLPVNSVTRARRPRLSRPMNAVLYVVATVWKTKSITNRDGLLHFFSCFFRRRRSKGVIGRVRRHGRSSLSFTSLVSHAVA